MSDFFGTIFGRISIILIVGMMLAMHFQVWPPLVLLIAAIAVFVHPRT